MCEVSHRQRTLWLTSLEPTCYHVVPTLPSFIYSSSRLMQPIANMMDVDDDDELLIMLSDSDDHREGVHASPTVPTLIWLSNCKCKRRNPSRFLDHNATRSYTVNDGPRFLLPLTASPPSSSLVFCESAIIVAVFSLHSSRRRRLVFCETAPIHCRSSCFYSRFMLHVSIPDLCFMLKPIAECS
ncbi:hypothetical protein LXL04_018713 [Taraxacum kok-saghyz]